MTHEPVLITGVGRRLGYHLANTLLQRQVPVIGTYRSQRQSLDNLASSGAKLYQCDFYREADIQKFIADVRADYPVLRAIIHNASDWLPDNAELAPADIMQRMMAVHVSAPYQINFSFSDLLLNSQNEFADIIHVGDYVSSRGSKKHMAYAASKAAQDNLTLSFAAKLAPKVKVNSIAPALMLFHEKDGPAYREKAMSKSLIEREGGYCEFLQAVDYLMNSNYVTGRILSLDGGRHLK